MKRFGKTIAFLIALGLVSDEGWAQELQPVQIQAPEFLKFEELKELSRRPFQPGELREKFEGLWKAPIVNNQAALRGVEPIGPTSPKLGKYIRVVTWNVEQSLRMADVISAFTDRSAFEKLVDTKKAKPGTQKYKRIFEERALLEKADIILLQEMDIGVKRSHYLDAARELAEALDMNFAYLPEYLELDPVVLGTEKIYFKKGKEDKEATAFYAADPNRYKGLFGCAVLSRYPIIHAEGFRLFHQGYDWYWREKEKTSFPEKLRRFGATHVLLENLHREVKLGGRTYFRVDLEVPDLPGGKVSVVNIHLEIKTEPQERAKQIAEILSYIKEIPHPVIMAGDFNSAPGDLSPTSTPRVVGRGLISPEFAVGGIINLLLPQALLVNVTRIFSNATKNYQNPTAPHFPLIAPNRVSELFRIIQRFRFSDGGSFDFRGSKKRSAGYRGKLANSNERDKWGYKITFKTRRSPGGVFW